MVIGTLLPGIAIGGIAAAIVFLAGFPLWFAFLVYSIGGALGVVGTSLLACAVRKVRTQSTAQLPVADR